MAKRFYGINRGQHQTDVVEGAATNSTDIELAVDLSKSLTRDEVMFLVQFIVDEIIMDKWPPA